MPHSLAPTLHAQFQSLQSCQVLSVQLPSATTCWSLSRHIGLPQLRPTRQQPQWSSRTEVRSGAPDAVFDAVFLAASNGGRGAVASFQSLRSFKIPLSREEIAGKPTNTWDLPCVTIFLGPSIQDDLQDSQVWSPCPNSIQFHLLEQFWRHLAKVLLLRTVEAAGYENPRYENRLKKLMSRSRELAMKSKELKVCNWSVTFYEFSIFYLDWQEHSKRI